MHNFLKSQLIQTMGLGVLLKSVLKFDQTNCVTEVKYKSFYFGKDKISY